MQSLMLVSGSARFLSLPAPLLDHSALVVQKVHKHLLDIICYKYCKERKFKLIVYLLYIVLISAESKF